MAVLHLEAQGDQLIVGLATIARRSNSERIMRESV
jgi:hypothetical protein